MFCSQCGKQIPDDSSFCEGCGAKLQCRAPVNNGVRIGFSDKINAPAIQAAVKKNSNGTFIFALILILAPVIVTLFIGVSNDDFSSLPVGLAISAVMLVFNLISAAKKNTEKQWDGTVIRKYTKEENRHDLEKSISQFYTVYIVEVRDDSGKIRSIKEGTQINSAHPYYDYLNAGDRIRFYPQFNNFYEKFDKTHDTEVNCPLCGSFNPLTEDVCEKCGAPILK